MMKEKKAIINVKGTEITIIKYQEKDFISLTDMVKNFEGGSTLIENWLRNKDTILFLGVWEQLNNPDFNSFEFEGIKSEAGRNSFYLSSKKWIDTTKAIGLKAKTGRYGGTFAHKDIAFEFGSWLSPEFKLYLITEFQRLKEDENRRLSLDWNLNRTLSRINYRIHTDAIKENIIPQHISNTQISYVYANEADVLNVALFGKTAKQWSEDNPTLNGNMREHASIKQLLVLANIESMNAEFIRMKIPQHERIIKLNQIAITQLKSLLADPLVKKIN
ncbi:KilA-N domain-containing protein [Pedobacter sp. MC2016-15]|uniref:KilA-N domain-containing protein n=1 Tax=Pedobacter sp. MC2016-15 TaxID=2994473 RepID=UPI0022451BF4|nr:KilA-N domain-containing protein [Pedobacter sp. MC2016-15]MCX2480069.1 KilA-N domain-containing protein [Pedobacter sp. MC2016-15]